MEISLPLIKYIFQVITEHSFVLGSYLFPLFSIWGVEDPMRLFRSIHIQSILGIEFQSHYRQHYGLIKAFYGRHFTLYGADKILETLNQIKNSMASWKLMIFQSHLLRERRAELLDPDGDGVLDIDSTTLVSFANKKEGAEVGFNRKYKGRPCFQLSGSLMSKVFIDGKLFAGHINAKEFFQKSVKRAIALGYRVKIVRGDAAYLSYDNLRFLLKRGLGYVLGTSGRFKVVQEGIELFKQRASTAWQKRFLGFFSFPGSASMLLT